MPSFAVSALDTCIEIIAMSIDVSNPSATLEMLFNPLCIVLLEALNSPMFFLRAMMCPFGWLVCMLSLERFLKPCEGLEEGLYCFVGFDIMPNTNKSR